MRAVVFDMDGVLFDTEVFYDEAWRRAGQVLGFSVEDAISACKGQSTAGTRRWFETVHPEVDFARFDALQVAQYDSIVATEGLPEKPGVHEILPYLKEKGYALALASSTGGARVRAHLRQAGIDGYFHVVVTGDMVQHSKPAPDIYLAACEGLGLDPAECLAVEDSYNGVRSAHIAGFTVAMVPDTQAPVEEITALTCGVFKELMDLRAIL